MVNLRDIEKKIRKFREGFDYSLHRKKNELLYFIFSEELKFAISPFPEESSVGGLKSEEYTRDGNHFSYEKGIDGSPDQFTVSKSVKSQKQGVIKREEDEEVKKWKSEAEQVNFPIHLTYEERVREVEKRRAEVEKRRAEVEKRRAEVEKRRAESSSTGDYTNVSFRRKRKEGDRIVEEIWQEEVSRDDFRQESRIEEIPEKHTSRHHPLSKK